MLWRRPVEAARPRGPVGQTGDALGGITRHSFADAARADARGSCGGLRRLPARHLHDDPLSTNRRQSGILVDVHPVLLWNAKTLQPQLPRSGPDGQPIESSQLEPFPIRWNHLIEKESLGFKDLEHANPKKRNFLVTNH
jgi:hypothetical protein